MGLAEWFSGFCSNILVQDGGTISSRYKTITWRLNADFWDTTSDVDSFRKHVEEELLAGVMN